MNAVDKLQEKLSKKYQMNCYIMIYKLNFNSRETLYRPHRYFLIHCYFIDKNFHVFDIKYLKYFY